MYSSKISPLNEIAEYVSVDRSKGLGCRKLASAHRAEGLPGVDGRPILGRTFVPPVLDNLRSHFEFEDPFMQLWANMLLYSCGLSLSAV